MPKKQTRKSRTEEQKQYDLLSDELHNMQRHSGLTQRDIADQTGWSNGKVAFVMNNPDRAKASDLRKLAFNCGYLIKFSFDEIKDKRIAPDYRK